ncbi:MAG TPA: hypothetical protein VFO16_20615, partial [Pseudonocardiaceae bacterium]|nr:hypothetical protein [Pseudonocardiaceae bacterium]
MGRGGDREDKAASRDRGYAAQEGFQVLSGATDELASGRLFGALVEAFGLYTDSADPQRAEIGRLITRESVPSQDFVADLGFR